MQSITTNKESHRSTFIRRVKRLNLHNHPLVVPVTTFLLLFFFTLAVSVSLNGNTVGASDSHVVRVSINGRQETIPTRAQTVNDLLQRMNVQITEKDLVEPALDTPINADNFSVNVYKARPVTILDNGHKTTVFSAEPTPRAVAESAGVTVYPEDKVEKSTAEATEPSQALREGLAVEQIVIDRATPVNVNLYGNAITVRTQAKTVGEVLKDKNINLAEGDTLEPKIDTPVTTQTQIIIVRVGKQVASSEETIPSPIQTVPDSTMMIGTTAVKQHGVAGKKLVTYEVELQNGQEVSRKVLQEVVTDQPTTTIILKGTKQPTITVTGDRATLMSQAGIPTSQHYAADYIISHESGWRLAAQNSGGCLGLGQACPGSKLVAACPSYASDAICQLRYFTGYANGRYGSWSAAYQFWLYNHWW
jgi:resuscitation-promoting factor RpfB